jgi:hypothetical protein
MQSISMPPRGQSARLCEALPQVLENKRVLARRHVGRGGMPGWLAGSKGLREKF